MNASNFHNKKNGFDYSLYFEKPLGCLNLRATVPRQNLRGTVFEIKTHALQMRNLAWKHED